MFSLFSFPIEGLVKDWSGMAGFDLIRFFLPFIGLACLRSELPLYHLKFGKIKKFSKPKSTQ